MALNQLTDTRYGKMLYNVNDTIIGKSLELYGEWYQSELDFLKSYIKTGWHCLDIGANIGTHTLFFAECVGSDGAVYAFEPQRLIFQLLSANVALNSLKNVFLFQAAMDEALGFAMLPLIDYTKPANFGGLRIDRNASSRDDYVHIIEVLTVDSLNLEKLNLIKVDVEGAELRVLKGAFKTIAKHRPLLYIENHRQENSPAILKLLKTYNYRAYEHLAAGFNPKNFKGNKANPLHGSYHEKNLFGVPEELQVPVSLKAL